MKQILYRHFLLYIFRGENQVIKLYTQCNSHYTLKDFKRPFVFFFIVSGISQVFCLAFTLFFILEKNFKCSSLELGYRDVYLGIWDIMYFKKLS